MRIGGGGYANIMMDGISAMDTGNNGQMIAMNTDAVAEVKVLTSAYQAEYGRSSGIQVLSVTKSGTNQFRGSVYDIERNSDWNKNSWYNIQNGHREGGLEAARLGLLDWRPDREARRQQQAVLLLQPRVPAAHERQRRADLPRADRARAAGRLLAVAGQPREPVPVHQGLAATGLPCSASNTAGCFQDGGVLGWIPRGPPAMRRAWRS